MIPRRPQRHGEINRTRVKAAAMAHCAICPEQDPGFSRSFRGSTRASDHFSAIRTGTQRRSPIGSILPTLSPDGANLPQCLAYHFTQASPIWTAVQRLMETVLPDVGDLVVPMTGSEIEIAFIDPNSDQRRNLKDLGSGVEQVLMTAYVGESQPPGSVVLIEEPETSLHPAAQRELLRHLLRFAEDRLVVATTHSSSSTRRAAQRLGLDVARATDHWAFTALSCRRRIAGDPR